MWRGEPSPGADVGGDGTRAIGWAVGDHPSLRRAAQHAAAFGARGAESSHILEIRAFIFETSYPYFRNFVP
jgi:hypothetical protein